MNEKQCVYLFSHRRTKCCSMIHRMPQYFLLSYITLSKIVNRDSRYSRTPVTRTLKGNQKQFELARVWVTGVDCKIQFARLKIDSYWFFSALQCMVQCKFNLFIRNGNMIRHFLMIKRGLFVAPIKSNCCSVDQC